MSLIANQPLALCLLVVACGDPPAPGSSAANTSSRNGTGQSVGARAGSERVPSLTRGETATQKQIAHLAESPGQASPSPVRGIVVGPGGRPLAGARVTLFRREREWPRRDRHKIASVRSGLRGGFRFGTPRSRDLEVEVIARGCSTQTRLAARGVEVLRLQLTRGFRVFGQVFLPGGRVAAGCAVFLEPGVASRMPARPTRTDSEGHFMFFGVPAENLRLTARHRDYRPATIATVTIGRRGGYVLDFEQPGLSMAGRVVSAETGEPVAGSEVRVFPLTPNGVLYVPQTAVTANNGRYRVRGLGPGTYDVEVRHRESSSVLSKVRLARSRTRTDFELPARVQLRGRLLGAKDIANKKLTLVSYFGEVATATVGPDGSFQFAAPGVSRGVATVEIEEGEFSFKLSQSRWVPVPLNEDRGEIQLEVQRASVLAGKVCSDDGKPLPGVQILGDVNRVADLGLLSVRRQVLAVTDKSGVYTIRGLSPGDLNLYFRKARFGLSIRPTKVVLEQKIAKLRQAIINMHRPGTITGRVTRGGSPVPGALVFVGKGFAKLASVITDARGRYALTGLPAGSHVVRVKFATLPIARSATKITVTSTKETAGVDIDLPAGRRLRGRVIDLEDWPMGHVIVESQAGTITETDEKGRFTLDIPNGRTILNFRLRRGDPVFDSKIVRRNDGRAAGEKLIRLGRASRCEIRAKVVRLPSKRGVAGVIVRLDPPNLHTSTYSGQTAGVPIAHQWAQLLVLNKFHQRGELERWVDTPDGDLDLPNLPDGPYKITLLAKGLQPFSKDVRLENGKIEDLGIVELREGIKVTGVVVNPRGEPVVGASVVLGRESDLNLRGAGMRYVTDARGRFTVAGVGLKHKRIFVAAKGYATQVHEFKVPEDALRRDPVRVQMQQGATISVVVVDRDGDRVPFRVVQLSRGFVQIREVEADERGVAWFHNLSKGTYHLNLRGQRRRVTQQVRDTKGGRVYTVKFLDWTRRRGR